MPKLYNRHNFHKHTFCVFKEVSENEIENRKPNHLSKSGSAYYFTEEGVYRMSNHWGRAANCRWRLESSESRPNQHQKVGYAKWTDFYPNNEQENLFYIAVNWDTLEVSFQHKMNPEYDSKAQLRNASETAKVMRQIYEVLNTSAWAKYMGDEDMEVLRKAIVTQLIQTKESFLEIKRKLMK